MNYTLTCRQCGVLPKTDLAVKTRGMLDKICVTHNAQEKITFALSCPNCSFQLKVNFFRQEKKVGAFIANLHKIKILGAGALQLVNGNLRILYGEAARNAVIQGNPPAEELKLKYPSLDQYFKSA